MHSMFSVRFLELKTTMVVGVNKLSAPFYVQFEVTDRCNNRCFFCYNDKAPTFGNELTLKEIWSILRQLKEAGVFSINFNGGEPLMRPDFFEIMEYAHYLGFSLHMNTNATLIDDYKAKRIARCMGTICTSILRPDECGHDCDTGRKGAYRDAIKGIQTLVNNGVKVEVNVCTHKKNVEDIYKIAELVDSIGCYALCSTRYILNSKDNVDYLLDKEDTEFLIDTLYKARQNFKNLKAISLPGPVPFCEISPKYHEKLAELNVPCQFGYGLCRISATGNVTPCTISDEIIGDLRNESFKDVWNSNKWDKYVHLEHLPVNCRECDELRLCRGGMCSVRSVYTLLWVEDLY